MLACAQEHPVEWKIPKIIFRFREHVMNADVTEALKKMGVDVWDDSEMPSSIQTPASPITRCCLDTSALFCLCSEVTNGDPFSEAVLSWAETNEQRKLSVLSEQERRPHGDGSMTGALADLMTILEGMKERLVPASIKCNFVKILKTVGGPREQARWAQWENKLEVVEEAITERAALVTGVKKAHRLLFGTGEMHSAVVITANGSFVRKAEAQNLDFPHILIQTQWLVGL